jgi:hypothetical protein
MPNRDWGGISVALTIGVIVALMGTYVAWGWGFTSWQRSDAERRAYDRAGYAEEYIERACVGMDRAALIECIQDAIESAREDQRSEYDLAAQEQMAKWAWWLLLTSIGTVLTAGVGIYYVRESLIDSRRIGQAQVRAYITIEKMKVVPRIVGQKIDWRIVIHIYNCGQSPAREILVKMTSTSRTAFDGEKTTITRGLRAGRGKKLGTRRVSAIGNHVSTVKGDERVTSSIQVEVSYRDVFWKKGERPTSQVYHYGGLFSLTDGKKLNSYVIDHDRPEDGQPDDDGPHGARALHRLTHRRPPGGRNNPP